MKKSITAVLASPAQVAKVVFVTFMIIIASIGISKGQVPNDPCPPKATLQQVAPAKPANNNSPSAVCSPVINFPETSCPTGCTTVPDSYYHQNPTVLGTSSDGFGTLALLLVVGVIGFLIGVFLMIKRNTPTGNDTRRESDIHIHFEHKQKYKMH
jgi:beta-lactamase regulating signal transducer with metallopeptidase domain